MKKVIKVIKTVENNQKKAIILGKTLAGIIVGSEEISKVFLHEMKNISPGTKRSEIMKQMTQIHPYIKNFSNETLRCAARIALKDLLTPKEYKELTEASMKKHGTSRIHDLQNHNGTKLLTNPEKEILDAIGKNPAGYKNGSVRNIRKIMEKIKEVIDFPRSENTIEKYMKQFSAPAKKLIFREDNPEEVAYLKELFNTHHILGEKLPTQSITDQLNAKFNHNRSQGAVECYIRTHFKTSEAKQLFTSNIWCGEEKDFIRNIITHPEQYKYSGGQFHGGYNLGKIMQKFKERFPDSERTKPAIKHQIDKQEKLIKKGLQAE